MQKSGLNIKGSAFKAMVEFVREGYGEADLLRVLDEVEAETREAVRVGVFISNWYAIEVFEDFIRTTDRVLGQGDLALVGKMGAFSAAFGLNVVYRTVIRMGSPEFALGKASMMWSRYYDKGQIKILSLDKQHIAMKLVDTPYISDIFCPRITGWMQRFLELTGVKDAKVVHEKCVRRGNSHCEWHGRWR